jgi:hypothetical protein
LSRGLAIFGSIVGVAYVAAGIAGGIWPGHWDDAPASDQILWVVFLVAGGVLILAGLRVFPRSPWGGAALIGLGALLGGLVLFWTIVVLVAALVLIAWSIVAARRTSGAAPVPD